MTVLTKIRILIVEDELIIAEDIKMKLSGLGYFVVGIANDIKNAEQIIATENPDIVILDIMLRGKMDGITLGQIIRNRYHIPFIFLTSYADKATIEQAKQVKPDGYLIKPFTDKDLYSSIEVALFRYSETRDPEALELGIDSNFILKDSIFIKKDYILIKIKFDDLQWIKSEGNYLELHCANEKMYLTRSTLKDFLDRLPKNIFLQIHKSYTININHIDSIEHSNIVIKGQKIPIGRIYIENIKKILHIEF